MVAVSAVSTLSGDDQPRVPLGVRSAKVSSVTRSSSMRLTRCEMISPTGRHPLAAAPSTDTIRT